MKCIKCGSSDIYTVWHACEYSCSPSSHSVFAGEHLHRFCRGCHFEWRAQTLDSALSDPGELDVMTREMRK